MSNAFWMLLACDAANGAFTFMCVTSAAVVLALMIVSGDPDEWFCSAKKYLVAFVMFGLISNLIPSRRDIVESYSYSEASKVVTGENAEKLVEETVKRIDKVTDALVGKLK